jgi:hypothetical protein
VKAQAKGWLGLSTKGMQEKRRVVKGCRREEMQEEEERRHVCEVREWLKRRAAMGPREGKPWLAKVLQDIAKKRGAAAAERLRNDIVDQWKAGNRGEPGDWRG